MALKWRDSEWVLVAGLNQDGCVCGGIERVGGGGWGIRGSEKKMCHLVGFNRVTLWDINIRPRSLQCRLTADGRRILIGCRKIREHSDALAQRVLESSTRGSAMIFSQAFSVFSARQKLTQSFNLN